MVVRNVKRNVRNVKRNVRNEKRNVRNEKKCGVDLPGIRPEIVFKPVPVSLSPVGKVVKH